MSTILCNIVSAESEIFSGQVEMVVATGTLGELGITPGHSQLLTGIKAVSYTHLRAHETG